MLEIRISGNIIIRNKRSGAITLWSNGKDRFSCNSLAQLETALKEHEDLKWMNK